MSANIAGVADCCFFSCWHVHLLTYPLHYDAIKLKHFPRYSPFVRGIHWSPVNSPHKGQWRRALMVSLICTWKNSWTNNRDAGDLRHHRTNHDVSVMCYLFKFSDTDESWMYKLASNMESVSMTCCLHDSDVMKSFQVGHKKLLFTYDAITQHKWDHY